MIRIIEKDSSTKDYEQTDKHAIETLRHTASHVMAEAIKRLYKDAKLAIGPFIDNGFYYDIDFGDIKISDEDFPKIEEEMKKIVKENATMERYTMKRDEAIKFFEAKNEPYKVELINDLPVGEDVYFAKQNDFVDLCGGSHLLHIGDVKHFKLMSVAGAYWRGDEKNKMLTRIYATAFFKKEELDAYINMIEESKKRDHRKLGKELSLFMLSDYGPGFPFFLPKGMILRNALLSFWRDIHLKNGYDEISTPVILNRTLWETSGHWDHYKENMYTTIIDEQDFAVKPMNCPGSILVYQNEPRSYRDLPLRLAECGLVHRHEKSGELHGLMRVRNFTQDDAHIFITEDQIEEEVTRIIKLIDSVYKVFKFDYFVELSTRPDDRMGTDAEWDRAEAGLANALKNNGIEYILNEGDGAFYGPKIDFHLRDCLGRTWQCGTIQLDIQLPQRFNLSYIGEDGEKHQPIMIHRVCFGSVERFMGILIEHFAGAFPTWLSPTQVEVIPVSDKTLDYAMKVKDEIEKAGIRVHVDTRAEKMGYKIREAQMQKIPYMVVVGQKEAEESVIALRSRFKGDEGVEMLSDVIERIKKEIDSREITKVEAANENNMIAIACLDAKNGIGKDGKLLISIPDDMKFFRENTKNQVVVMGRKTLFSFKDKAPLKNRINIVFTTNDSLKDDYKSYDNIFFVKTEKELDVILLKYPDKKVFLLGGAKIYSDLIDKCDTALITRLDKSYEADAYFPDLISHGFKIVNESETKTYEDINYKFVTYKK